MHTSLVNFNAPIDVRKRFDAICNANGRTRTSVLVELINNYILQEGRRLIKRQEELGVLDKRFQESMGLNGSNHRNDVYHQSTHPPLHQWGDKEFDLPALIYSDGQGDW